MKTLGIVLLALVLHLILGWAWTLLAGVVAGVWVGRRGWLVGGLGVGAEWLALVVFNLLVASGPVGRMLGTMGGILGNMPGVVVVAVTLLIGLVLGTVGGMLGSQLKRILRPRKAIAT